MNPDVYWYALVATVAGGLTGALVLWNRQRSQTAGEDRLRRMAGLLAGTAASAWALAAFTKAFRGHERIYAAMVMILIAGWVAGLHSVVPLSVSRAVQRVRTGEFAFLRAPWTGVRLFGAFLRAPRSHTSANPSICRTSAAIHKPPFESSTSRRSSIFGQLCFAALGMDVGVRGLQPQTALRALKPGRGGLKGRRRDTRC